jgi:hypothetical protein
VSIKRYITLTNLPPSPVHFGSYEDFLVLTEEEMRLVVKAVSRARIDDLLH